MANANILTKTLRIGVDEPLYVGANASPAVAGAISTTGTAGTGPTYGCFGLPPQCSNYRGNIWFQFVAVGGTVTTVIFKVETSLDGGVTWGVLNRLFPITAAPVTLTSYSTITTGAFTTPIVIGVDVSGLGGNGMLRLNFTTVTLGTATGVDVYTHIG